MLPKSLREGYRRYCRDRHTPDRGRLIQLAALGQSPHALVISCCDARVEPHVIFDTGPGELFTVSNVANLVPPYESEGRFHGTSAAIEFAVLGLRVPHIVVLGHSHCGGVRAYSERRYDPKAKGSFVSEWMSILDTAPEAPSVRSGEPSAQDLRELELSAIRVSLANLRTFPAVAEAEAQQCLTLHGAHYDIATGHVIVLDQANGTFAPLFDSGSLV